MAITFERALAKLEGLIIQRHRICGALEYCTRSKQKEMLTAQEKELSDRIVKGQEYMAKQWPFRWKQFQRVSTTVAA